ncbi:MAG: ABC transporter permease, partial [Gemmatimonadetes bacterium]|nr:ABC transporter permease [Gemmatimonadota bacterium]
EREPLAARQVGRAPVEPGPLPREFVVPVPRTGLRGVGVDVVPQDPGCTEGFLELEIGGTVVHRLLRETSGPAAFTLPDLTEVWGARILSALGRTTQASPEATAELEAELGTLASDIPDMARWRAEAVPLEESLLRDVRRPLTILQGAVALVLVIACANVGILLSVRGMRRRGDAAVRKALGASRARLAAMGLVESVGLSALAGALGLGAAALALEPALQAVPAGFPRASEVDLHPGVALFALVMALGTGLLAGAAPAAQAWGAPVAPTLNEAGSGRTPSRGARRIRATAVAGQVALSVVLLAAAGVLTRSFLTVLAQDPGFRPDGIVTFDLSLNGAPYEEPSAQLSFVESLLGRLEALASADVAAVARNLPVSGSTMTSPVDIEGRGATPEPAQIAWVSPGYFRLMGVPVLDGRAFGAEDGPEGRPVAMVDEAFARRFLPGEAAVGVRARSYFGGSPPREVIGVAGAVRHGGLTEAPPPVFYEPFLQAPSGQLTLLVRSTAPTGAVVADVRAVLRGLDPALPVRAVATMDERIGRSVATHRFYASVMAGFAALSLLLTMVGSYSVLSHSVAERRREIGIRMALGAPAGAVRGEVIRQALGVTLLGLVVGTSGALLATRALRGLLFGVGPADPLVLASLPVLLAAAALAAAWLPARRATAVDPAGTLRDG